jgi:iron complex outermembrane recepter protein
MLKRTRLHAAIATAAAAGALANTALAQQEQRIEITGSAIKRIDAETAVPVTILRMEELRAQGITTIEQVVQNIAASTSVTTTAQVVGSGTGGASFADLRGIGADKTLILLNGRRIANNALQSSVPDLNMIPFAALDRVEVLRDGASALYGTDAIGGVINFITRRGYDGGEVSLSAEKPQEDGGEKYGANLALGVGNLETDRFNLLGVIDVQRNKRINSQQRAFGSRSYIPDRGFDGTSPTTFPANYSQRQQNGVDPVTGDPIFVTRNANPTFPGCAPVGNGGSINTGASTTNCRFDPTPYQDLTPDVERASFFGRASLRLGNDHTGYVEYFRTRNVVETIIGPVPEGGLTMTSDSPFFPGNGITPAPTNFTIDPALPIAINWRTSPAGGRSGRNENTSQRFIVGLEGAAAGWDYNVGVVYNENKLVESLIGGYVNDELIQAGVADGTLNPFGAQTSAGAAYLGNAALRGELQTAKGRVWSVDGKVSRELGTWFAGANPAAIALGAEFRKEKFFDDINAPVASQAASTGVDPESDVTGDRHVSAFFAELAVPITKTLEATAAVRHDRYSDFGSTTNPKFALRYQPVPAFLARATYSTGFRAPSLYELYQPNFLTFTAGQYNDPLLCPGGVPANPSVDPGTACNLQFLQQGGGNPNLKPEKSRNFTIGLVFEPLAGMTLGLDFWWIRMTNQINAFPEQAIFGDPVAYAGRFVRDAQGTLDPNTGEAYVVATNDNLGEIKTQGVDVSASYRWRLGGGDNFALALNGTYVNKYEYQREINGPFFQNVNQFVDTGVIFRWKQSLTGTYAASNWSVGLTNRYQSAYTDENFVDDPYLNKVGAYSVWDLFGSWTPIKPVTIAAGVRNLLDKDPPFSNQTQTFQAGYDPRYTDPTGRAFYVRLNYTFK